VLASWAIANGYIGGPEDIRARAESMTSRFHDDPDPWRRAMVRLVRGLVEFEFTPGGSRRAEDHLRAALAGFEEVGDRWGLVFTLFELAEVLANRDAAAEAVTALERARRLGAELGGGEEIPAPLMLLVRLGRLRVHTGDLTGARADLDEARTIAEGLGDPVALARVHGALGAMSCRQGDLAAAAERYRAALALAEGQDAPRQFLALLHTGLGRVETRRGHTAAARDLHERALALISETRDDIARADVLEGAAEWHTATGDAARATALGRDARALRGLAEAAGDR
jgi:tetratricopeptide (TPR) repeat protein